KDIYLQKNKPLSNLFSDYLDFIQYLYLFALTFIGVYKLLIENHGMTPKVMVFLEKSLSKGWRK
ncbi:hypothetical protein ACFL1Z_04375, partial [Thermodesulfobacteriota bacterium]